MKVLVVGSGTAGMVSALILRKHLNIQVDVLHSPNIGIVGVGEGSTEHFNEFMNFVGISDIDIIKECDATYKAGIMFKGWSSNDYMHHVGTPFNTKASQYSPVYGALIAEGANVTPSPLWKNQINRGFLNQDIPPFNQYHFNTYKLQEFLIKFAKNMGINVIEDELKEVFLREDGSIESVLGEKRSYKYDFYIDCTGFKRFLIGKTTAKWKSYSKYLKMNSAVVFPTEEESEYKIYTTAKAMDYGWMFTLPVWGRNGNGYIFDSSYIGVGEAKKEVEKLYKKELPFGKEFSFDPGCLDTPWVKNCVAIGLSGSFFEPLEATSIGTSIQQSFLLMHRLINYSQPTIDEYNKAFTDIAENIRDFVVLHYQVKKFNSIFWKDVQNLEIPDTLATKLDLWKRKLPIKEDFNSISDYALFQDSNFIVVLDGLDLFDRDAIRREYEAHSNELKGITRGIINAKLDLDANGPTLGHKAYLQLIRDNF
jgi:tryptophan halogenase